MNRVNEVFELTFLWMNNFSNKLIFRLQTKLVLKVTTTGHWKNVESA